MTPVSNQTRALGISSPLTRAAVLAVLVFLLDLIAPAPSAWADSVNHCIDSCMDTYNSSNQSELQQTCVNQCRNRVNYGAIAFSVLNGANGSSYGYHSADEADQRALSNCEQRGDGCKVVIGFSETCAALAAGDDNRFAANLGDGRGSAENSALAGCHRNGVKNCAIKASTCARD